MSDEMYKNLCEVKFLEDISETAFKNSLPYGQPSKHDHPSNICQKRAWETLSQVTNELAMFRRVMGENPKS